jgi:hypothetical protein
MERIAAEAKASPPGSPNESEDVPRPENSRQLAPAQCATLEFDWRRRKPGKK